MTPVSSAGASVRVWGTLLACEILLCGAVPPVFAMQAPGDSMPQPVDLRSGAAVFEIPIDVPPGPGGFAPSVRLTYSSHNGDGIAGVGWQTGFGELRCSARFGVPDYATCSRYELNGQLLTEDPTTPGRYHTYTESFARITRTGTGSVPDSWLVELPDGTIQRYGLNPGARVQAPSGVNARWLLSEMEDPFGNKIYFSYETYVRPDTTVDVGVRYPAMISYGPGAGPGSGKREVVFRYEDRPDPIHGFAGGLERRMTRRLQEVQVLSYDQVYQRLLLTYAPAANGTTTRSRLASARVFGSDCTDTSLPPVEGPGCSALPPREFDYRDPVGQANAAFGSGYGLFLGTPHWWADGAEVHQFGDIDGDGRVDLLYDTGVLLNVGTGWTGDPGTLSDEWSGAVEAITFPHPMMHVTMVQPQPELGAVPPILDELAVCAASVVDEGDPGYSDTVYGLDWWTATRGKVRGLPSWGAYSALSGAAVGTTQQSTIKAEPAAKLVDVNADGLADIVISVRLSGVTINAVCNGPNSAFLAPSDYQYVPGKKITKVFRNSGDPSTGFVDDPSLAGGLPAFEEIGFESPAYVASAMPVQPEYWNEYLQEWFNYNGVGACMYRGLLPHVDQANYDLCWNESTFDPRFIDLNGDGYQDLMVLEREDPASHSILFGPDLNAENLDKPWSWGVFAFAPPSETSQPRSRVWIQDPDAASGQPRWVRDSRFDLPNRDYDETKEGWAHSVLATPFYDNMNPSLANNLIPTTSNYDAGVRLADVNADGLPDVVWRTYTFWNSLPAEGLDSDNWQLLDSGVLLNTGAGWCTHDVTISDNNTNVAECAVAAGHVPPGGGFARRTTYYGTVSPLPSRGQATGYMGDVNGDGLPDYLELDYYDPNMSGAWWQCGGSNVRIRLHLANPGGGWTESDDPPIDALRAQQICNDIATGSPGWVAAFSLFDANGDGAADFVGSNAPSSYEGAPSRATLPDLIDVYRNGQGGTIRLDYAPALTVRDSALEAVALDDAEVLGEVPGVSEPDFVRWSGSPVVTEVTVEGPNIASSPDWPKTTFQYAHPRFSHDAESHLGFRLVQRTRPDGSVVEESHYQHPGVAGRTSGIRVIKDGEDLYEATWTFEQAPSGVTGTLEHPDVHNARIVNVTTMNWYAGVAGAERTLQFSYDDNYGFNFASCIKETRPSSTLVRRRVPWSDTQSSRHIYGLAAVESLHPSDSETQCDSQAAPILAYASTSYVGDKPEVRTVYDQDRTHTSPQSGAARATAYGYDDYGNLTSETLEVPGDSRTIEYCYDGDGQAWCPHAAGHDSLSIRIGARDPLGGTSLMTPDALSGKIVATASSYQDVAGTRVDLDEFSRPITEYSTPVGSNELVMAEVEYNDYMDPPTVERIVYPYAAPTDFVRTATVSDGFGGIWKAIERTPSGYVGTAFFRNLSSRAVRETLPFDCDGNSFCETLTGNAEPAVAVTTHDPLGRPVSILTSDGGLSLAEYAAEVRVQPAGREAGSADPLDRVLIKNGKGDLIRRVLDGDRVIWVDECNDAPDASISSLAGVGCANPDTTFYSYDPTGEIETIYTARAVATNNFAGPNLHLRYTYDTLGRIRRIDDPDLDGTGYTTTSYDYAGNPLVTTNARGQARTYQYDRLNRLESITTPATEPNYSVGHKPNQLQPWWDDSSDGLYSSTYRYDGLGRLERRTVVLSGLPGGTSTRTYLTDYEYDLLNRLTKIRHPAEDATIGYQYVGAYLERVCDLDSSDDCATELVSDVEYDDLGRRESMIWSGGTRTFSYDPSTHRLTRDRFDGDGAFWYQRDYLGYDEIGNLEAVTSATSVGDSDAAETYSYDQRNRLVGWTLDGLERAYDYDDLGNLILHAASPQVFDDPERPHAIKSRTDDGVTYHYQYDYDGNVEQRTGGAEDQYYGYDSANRLVCRGSEEGSCDLAQIRYDIHGNRLVSMPAGGGYIAYPNESFVHMAAIAMSEIQVLAFGERIARKRVAFTARTASLESVPFDPDWLAPLGLLAVVGLTGFAARLGAFVLVVRRPGHATVVAVAALSLTVTPKVWAGGGGGPQLFWELADPLGSSLILVDDVGDRAYEMAVAPFGEVRADWGSATYLRTYYAGHEYDKASGLVYMNARWYEPGAGVFMGVDPLVGAAGNPQSHNAYGYVLNNPVKYDDPTGMVTDDRINDRQNKWAEQHYAGPINVPSFAAPPMIVDLGDFGTIHSYDGGAQGMVDAGGSLKLFVGHMGGATQMLSALGKALAWFGGGVPAGSVSFARSQGGQYASNGAESPDGRWVGGSYEQMMEVTRDLPPPRELWPEGATRWDPIEGYFYGDMSTSSPIDWIAGGIGARAGARIAGTAAQAGLKSFATTGAGQKLFARGTGALNSNNYIRLGMGWKGSAKTGQEVFRLVIGNKNSWIHWHWP